MADFTAVIQRAVDGLADKSPEMRAKVYEKARTAVQRQLNAMNPPPPEDMVARQMGKLDEAVAAIEAKFATAEIEAEQAAEESEATTVEQSASETVENPGDAASPENEREEPRSEDDIAELRDEPVPESEEAESVEDETHESEADSAQVEAEGQGEHEELASDEDVRPDSEIEDRAPETEPEAEPSPEFDEDNETSKFQPAEELPAEPAADVEPSFDENHSEKEEADPLLDTGWPEIADKDPLSAEEWDVPSIDDEPQHLDSAEHLDDFAEPSEPDVPDEADEAGIVDAPVVPDFDEYTSPATPKDIDDVVASLSEATYSEGEDRSGGVRTVVIILALLVALGGAGFAAWQYKDSLTGLMAGGSSEEQTAPSPTEDAGTTDQDAAEETAEASADTGPQKFTQRLMADGTEVDTPAGPAATGDEEGKSVAQQSVSSDTSGTQPPSNGATAVAAAQKIFLYEERLGQASPTALEGTVVWSRQTETQDVGNPQPVIQAKIEVPERSLSAMVTFRRNIDPSLPASHIIELVFSLPEDFEGGGIENVVRISMKQHEQDQGTPLIGVPARITDYFHMIALNALPEAEKTNLQLLKTMDWIDIPIVYGNGRRALLALQKGTDGEAIFSEVMSEWDKAGQGQ